MPMPQSEKPPKAFKGLTFIEMLIASMILAVIAIAVNSSLNSGVRVWRKVNQELPQEGLNLFFDKFTHDLSNILKSAKIRLEGDGERLVFSSLVSSPRFTDKTPGEIIYVYDKGKSELRRFSRDYSDIYTDKQGSINSLLSNIVSLRFNYYFFEKERNNYSWTDTWDKEGLPRAVRVEIEINDEDKVRKFNRIVSIPIGL
jgi:prepilin-type N-terminal cleavage/methylation domain-containing protein